MYSEISQNKIKTILLMASFMGIVSLLGWLFSLRYGGNYQIFVAALVSAGLYTLFSYFAGSRMALAINGAHEIQKRDNPRLWRTVENISITEGLPMPRVFIIDDKAPNAFATGRTPDKSMVCATTGLLDMMDDRELEGVMAHEMGHIKNYDIRVSMIAFALVGVVSFLADMFMRFSLFGGSRDDDNRDSGGNVLALLSIIAAILAPIAASLIQLAISRRREYLADATGALTTRDPEGLANALAKIGRTGSVMRRQNTSTAHLFFANPLNRRNITNLFSTHPPIEDRIRELHEMGAKL